MNPVLSSSEEVVKGLQAVPWQHELYASVFSTDNTILLPVNRHAYPINLEGDTILPVGPIYPLAETELKVLQTYIKNALVNKCI